MHPADKAFSEQEENLRDLATLRAAMATDDGTRYEPVNFSVYGG